MPELKVLIESGQRICLFHRVVLPVCHVRVHVNECQSQASKTFQCGALVHSYAASLTVPDRKQICTFKDNCLT